MDFYDNTNNAQLEIQSDRLHQLEMQSNKSMNKSLNILVAAGATHAGLTLALAILSLVFAQTYPDYTEPNPINLDLRTAINASGGVNLVTAMCYLAYGFVVAGTKHSKIFIFICISIRIAFGMAWFIITSILIFKYNLNRIHTDYPLVVWGLIQWCFSIVTLFTI